MKLRPRLCALFLCACLGGTRGLCVSEGETYDQVIAEKGKPVSQMGIGSRRILNYPDAVVKLENDVVTSVKAVERREPTSAPVRMAPGGNLSHPSDAGPMPSGLLEARQKLSLALARAREIINQPVDSVPMTPEIRSKAAVYQQGWVHDGAEIPHFIDAHIEASQEPVAAQYYWVTCNLTPGLAFRSQDREFNAQTKFFYMDRSLPKKRLSAGEMAELDVVYHKIGMYAAYLQRAGHPWTPTPGE
ncbi:MAG TPA: hypothetical protein VFE25_09080 [Opitutaceae bacterium]|nr:hypothetical protein [Opitutaceae bacterium]